MEASEAHKRIVEIEREISVLPVGGITTKKVNNGTYYYHRITVNGKRKEIYTDAEKALEMKEQIEKRKALEKELKKLKASLPEEKPISETKMTRIKGQSLKEGTI